MSPDASGPSISDRDRYDEEGNIRRIAALRARGVETWGPERVYIGPDVSLDRIQPGALLKLAIVTGESTWIGRGALVGTSGTAVVHDCQLGELVQLGAGLFEGATLLARAKARGFAELRPATLLEEEAEIAHTTGLKNTIFTAAVVAGSGVNFCDVFVSGGSSRSDHTEIGSGAVHFNFDPRGDKFGSLLGNARGLLLRQPRIFIGGNSGFVAPVQVDFGCLVPAGSTIRNDIPVAATHCRETAQTIARFDPNTYFDMSRKFVNTAKLVGNLHSLAMWYRTVRLAFAAQSDRPLYHAAVARVEAQIAHRTSELAKVVRKLDPGPSSAAPGNPFLRQHECIVRAGSQIQQWLSSPELFDPPEALIREYEHLRGKNNHCDAVRALSENACREAQDWLMRVPSMLVARFEALFQ